MMERNVLSGSDDMPSPAHLACQHPNLELENPEIYKFFHHVDPILCKEEAEWVVVRGSVASITKEAKKKHGDIECAFSGEFSLLFTLSLSVTLCIVAYYHAVSLSLSLSLLSLISNR
ncbi:hypothetical protein E2C01_074433 [Portunus trituberculatus]|uniref:Uncharacterized protein n=1 Tax=Portunus trituberculatus TaxID=210409 RepID=A0A5B7I5N1_PORTR|nr:hypothetical protein [Portunus trituberculatus]